MESDFFKVKCYDRSGSIHHEELCTSLLKAKEASKEWIKRLGLRPEPSGDFVYYPTIWEMSDNEWIRILAF